MPASEAAKPPKNRLSDMLVQEVSLVDVAANLKRWLITKADNMTTKTQKAENTVKLPGAAKQGMLDGITAVMDKVAAIMKIVDEAEVDDTATVPTEIATALKEVGGIFDAMAGQFASGPAPAQDGDNAPPPAPGPEAKGDETAKGLPSPQKDPPPGTELHDGDSLSTLLRKTTAAAHLEIAHVEQLEKAGRKMKGSRYKKLVDVHTGLGQLLNELAFDDASAGTAAGEAPAAAAPAEKGKAKKEDDEEDASKSKPTKKSDGGAIDLADILKKVESLGATVESIAKSGARSNAGSFDDVHRTPPQKGDTQWPLDMSKDLEDRRKTQGARR